MWVKGDIKTASLISLTSFFISDIQNLCSFYAYVLFICKMSNDYAIYMIKMTMR